MFEQLYQWKRPRARRFHDRWRIRTMLQRRAKINFGYGSSGNWQNFSVWEKVVEARERYVRAYYSTRVRCKKMCGGRNRNNYMTMQEHRALDGAEFQCRDEGVSLKHTRFKRNPW